ncbi:MAG TPA: SRPBCC family protein [Acidimicrobiales bacterium]|nr:SRPBCC family protein [Acidimicrobiales bacterium]
MATEMRAVGLDFFDTAPLRSVQTEIVRRSPAAVFDALARNPAGWGDWYPGFDHRGCWLTDGPPGVGSRRRVRMTGARFDETIIAWEPDHRFAFCVNRTNAPIARALAEDYVVTALPGPACVVQWTFAVDPGAVLRPTRRLFPPFLASLFRRSMANLEALIPATES